MKSRFLVQVSCLALLACGCSYQPPTTRFHGPPCALSRADVRWLQGALDGWYRVSKDFLLLDPKPLPWIVLFDSECTWHLAAGEEVPGSGPAEIRLTYAGEPVSASILHHDGKI